MPAYVRIYCLHKWALMSKKATKTIFVDLFKSVDKATNRFHDFLLAYTSSTSSSRNNEWTNTLLPVFTEPTRPSPHWPWGSSVKIKSPLPCSPLRRGVNPLHIIHFLRPPLIFSCCVAVIASVTVSSHHFFTYLWQIHLLLWWFVVRYHQNEQQSLVPAPNPHSFTTKLPGRRRSVL